MKSKVYCFKVTPNKQGMDKDNNNLIGIRTIARRISRACDECRKRKTRCIIEGRACQLCNSRNKLCGFELPSFKRGPKPKKNNLNTVNELHFKLDNSNKALFLSLPSPPNNFNTLDLNPNLSSSVTPTSELLSPIISGDGKQISSYIQRLYAQGSIVCLTPSQLNIILNYFYFLHDQNLLIDITRFMVYLTSPMFTNSFKFLINCMFIVATKNLPHLNDEYINLYSTEIITKELENLNLLMSSVFNTESEMDVLMNKELGLSLMNLPFN